MNTTQIKLYQITNADKLLRIDVIVPMETSLDMNNNRIRNVASPSESTDAANKAYVDSRTNNITFVSLSDTPNSYSGRAGHVVIVNSSANALEFTDVIDGGTL